MDDMVITSKDTGNLWVEGEDKWEFKIKDSSAVRKLQGGFRMEIMRDKQAKTLFLYWKDYTEKVVRKFCMENCKPESTPFSSAYHRLAIMQAPTSEKES